MTAPDAIEHIYMPPLWEVGDGTIPVDAPAEDDDLHYALVDPAVLAALPEVQELIRAETERLQSDRPFIMGANHGYDTAMDQVAEEAQRFAAMYPQSSDGRNTFEIFVDWARRMKDGPAFDAAIRGPKP